MAIDTFTNTNGTTLETHDTNWKLALGPADSAEIQSNSLADSSDQDWMYYWDGTGGNPGNDQWAVVTCTDVSGGWTGPCARVSASGGNGYHTNISNGTQYFGKWVSGGYTNLGIESVTVATGDKWKIEAEGTTIRWLQDSGGGFTEVFSQTDSSIASGNIGICGYPGSGRQDDFDGGAIGGASIFGELHRITQGLVAITAAGLGGTLQE